MAWGARGGGGGAGPPPPRGGFCMDLMPLIPQIEGFSLVS